MSEPGPEQKDSSWEDVRIAKENHPPWTQKTLHILYYPMH